MKYKMLNHEEYYFRKESNGTGILLIKKHGYQIFLNKTGSLIVELLDKFEDINEIFDELKIKFPLVDGCILKQDLNEMIDLFKLYTLIEIETSTNTVYSNITFAGDCDYIAVSKFIKNNLEKHKYNFTQVDSLSYFEPVALRYRTFHNHEYCISSRKDGVIQAVVMIIPPNGTSNVVHVSGLVLSAKIDKRNILEIIKKTIKVIIDKIPNQINKIRINQLNDPSVNTECELVDVFKELDFEKECILKKEMNNKDLVMFTKFLK